MKIIEASAVSEAAIIKPFKKYNAKLCINTQSVNHIVDKSDITYLKSDSNYCTIHLLDGSKIVCSKTLKEINGRIRNPIFVRVHTSFVVNVNEIISIDSGYNTIKLRGGIKIPISRTRKTNLKDIVKRFFD